MPQFVRHCEALSNGRVMGVDAYDRLSNIPIEKARKISFKGSEKDSRSLCFGYVVNRHGRVSHSLQCQKSFDHRPDFSSPYWHLLSSF